MHVRVTQSKSLRGKVNLKKSSNIVLQQQKLEELIAMWDILIHILSVYKKVWKESVCNFHISNKQMYFYTASSLG